MPYNSYANLESLIKKVDGCVNNPEKSSTTKIEEHIPCGYSCFKIWAFNDVETKHKIYSEDCMKSFCKSLRDHAMKIINFEKKKMIPLTNK